MFQGLRSKKTMSGKQPEIAVEILRDKMNLWQLDAQDSWAARGSLPPLKSAQPSDLASALSALSLQISDNSVEVWLPKSDVKIGFVRLGSDRSQAQLTSAAQFLYSDEKAPPNDICIEIGKVNEDGQIAIAAVSNDVLRATETLLEGIGLTPSHYSINYHSETFGGRPKFDHGSTAAFPAMLSRLATPLSGNLAKPNRGILAGSLAILVGIGLILFATGGSDTHEPELAQSDAITETPSAITDPPAEAETLAEAENPAETEILAEVTDIAEPEAPAESPLPENTPDPVQSEPEEQVVNDDTAPLPAPVESASALPSPEESPTTEGEPNIAVISEEEDEQPVAPAEPTPSSGLLALADPELATVKPRQRLALPADAAPAPTESDQAASLLNQADPELRSILPIARKTTAAEPTPKQPERTTIEGATESLLQSADPELAGLRPKVKPEIDTSQTVAQPGLLSLAEPGLAKPRARPRPAGLKPTEQQPIDDQEAQKQEAPEEPAVDPFATATSRAIKNSEKPRTKPRNFSRIVVRTITSQKPNPDKPAKAAATAPSAKQTTGTQAAKQTESKRVKREEPQPNISARRLSLIGVFGRSNARRAIVKLPSGRFVRVKAGDRVGGWRVAAIGADTVRIIKGNRNQTLRMPR